MVIASIQGLEDRDAAEALRGGRVFVSRASFPTATEGEYYWVDLIGLSVVNREGVVLGEVVAVHIDTALLKDGVYDTANAGHILRGGGPADYFTVGPEQLFRMYRPR